VVTRRRATGDQGLGEGPGEIWAVVHDEPAMGDVGAPVDVRGEAVATPDAEVVAWRFLRLAPAGGGSVLAAIGVMAALFIVRTLVWRRRSDGIAEPLAD
jgi:hypothetical protein